jgi:hypothetical protein
MLCGIKLKLDSRAISELADNSNLEFKSLLNRQTGEVDSCKIWSEDGITIFIKSSGYGHIKGSLHKYKNADLNNYDDFNWEQVDATTHRLSERLKLNVKALPLLNLEWGLNILLNFNPDQLLSGLVRHRGAPFEKMYVYPGNHFVANHDDYGIKIYNKASQNKLESNLLRFELSSNKSRHVNKQGIFCLADLDDREIQIQLLQSLISDAWDDILLIDPLLQEYEPYSSFNQLRVAKWNNPLFWNQLTRRARSYQLKQYEEFLFEHGMQTKEKIKKLLIDKFDQL